MSENTQRVLSQEEMAKLVTIAQFAKMVGCSSGAVRKAGKAGLIPGTYHVMGTIGFNPEEAKGWTPPVGSAARSKREDGRMIYQIALLADTELGELLGQGYEIVDPREESKKRRAQRKAAANAAEAAAGTVNTDSADDDEDVDDDDFFNDDEE